MHLVAVVTASLFGSLLVSGLPTNPKKRLTFKQRVEQLKALSNSTCTPTFEPATMYNIFANGNDSAVWEWIPTFYSGDSSKGGTVFVSGTDSPENGAYYFLPVSQPSLDNSTASPVNSTSVTHLDSTFRLNLADQPKGQHCIVAQDGRTLTTGSCENLDSIFLVSCSTCPGQQSGSTATTTGKVGSACTIRSTVPAISTGYCTSWPQGTSTIPGVPGYGAVSLRSCRKGSKSQEWDIVVAQ